MKIKLLTETAKIPTRGSIHSAGYDLYVDSDSPIRIAPNETLKLSTGISLEIPDNYFGAIYARSGAATKRGLRPANCTGVIDSDYRGEVIVAIHNDSEKIQIIEPFERIAQLIIQPYLNVDLEYTDTLSETTRGTGGFGSTGKI